MFVTSIVITIMIKFGLPLLLLKVKENWQARQGKQVRPIDPDYEKEFGLKKEPKDDIANFVEGILNNFK